MYMRMYSVCVYIYITCNTYIITSRILTHVGVSGFEYLDSPKERPNSPSATEKQVPP